MVAALRPFWLSAVLSVASAQAVFADWNYYTGSNPDGGARVAAGEPALVAQAVKYPPGRMPLLARHLQVLVEPMLDRRNKRIQLRTPDR